MARKIDLFNEDNIIKKENTNIENIQEKNIQEKNIQEKNILKKDISKEEALKEKIIPKNNQINKVNNVINSINNNNGKLKSDTTPININKGGSPVFVYKRNIDTKEIESDTIKTMNNINLSCNIKDAKSFLNKNEIYYKELSIEIELLKNILNRENSNEMIKFYKNKLDYLDKELKYVVSKNDILKKFIKGVDK